MKHLIIFAITSLCFNFISAQSVGIGTTTPNPSAALDITSVTQGILVPRMSTAQRTAISSPATGLLVYDMTSSSFWFRSSTQWVELIDTSNTVVHKNGTGIYMGMIGNVGIGTAAPGQKLHVVGNTNLQGNVGINMSSPVYPLNFPATTGDKIALFGSGSTNFGFGLAANLMQMYTPNASSAIGFGYGSSNAFTENMRLTGDGKLGIGTNTPSEKLSVAGNANFSGNLTLGGGLAVGLGVAVAGGAGFGGAVSVGAPSPNASAQLDVSSTTKGFLLPRMTTAQQNAINSPAQGLTVYNTDTNSPWYRTDNEWKEIEADTNSSAEQFVFRNSLDQIYMGLMDKVGIGTTTPLSGLDVARGIGTATARFRGTTFISEINLGSDEHTFITGGKANSNVIINDLPGLGNVGIGTSTPAQKLHVEGGAYVSGSVGIGISNPLIKLYVARGNSTATAVIQGTLYDSRFNVGVNENTYINGGKANSNVILNDDAALGNVGIGIGVPVQKLHVEGNSYISQNLGISMSTPHAPLQFSNTPANRKIVLFENSNNDYQFFGFGRSGPELIYQVSHSGENHVFYAGTSPTSSTELMRIQGNGNVGIGNINPLASLQVARGTGINGTAMFKGTTHASHFNYSTDENTVIRGGKANAHVILNDIAGLGNVGIGSGLPLQKLHVEGSTYISQKLGIGTITPNAPLQLANTIANRKIVLWEAANNEHEFYGLGINEFILRYQVSASTVSHVFYAASSPTTSNELMRIQGDGKVGIGVSSPSSSLEVARGTGINGTAMLKGTTNASHFNYSTDEHTYIRGGKANSNVVLNDLGGSGNVGIGMSTPHAPLQLANTIANRKIVLWEGTNNDHEYYGFGINGNTLRYQVNGLTDRHVFYAGASSTVSNELMRIQGNGNVGIGTSSPNAPLQFANTSQSRKIVMYENANNDHQFNGLGAEEGIMRYQVGNEEYDHVFYAAASSIASNELMRVKGNGDVDVSGKVMMGYSIQQSAINLGPLVFNYELVCNCPPNTKVLGGGYYGESLDTFASRPNASGSAWLVMCNNLDPVNFHVLTAYAVCARMDN